MMIIRASFMIVAAVAALAISARTRKNQGDTKQRSCERPDDEEMEQARLLAKDLRKRKSVLEKRLLKLHEAKDEYRLMICLRKRLSEKISEVESLESKVCELWAERDALEEEMRKSVDGVKELRLARSVITGLQEKIDLRKKDMKAVEERVDVVWRNDVRSNMEVRIGKDEKDDVSDMKMEALALQRMNKELELGRRELAFQLDAAREKIRGFLSRIENEHETVAEFKKEASSLRRANEDLQKRVDQLQKQRFGLVEELVYTRWLHICLRFEVEDFYEFSRKNPADSPHCDYRREWSAEYVEKTRRILGAISKSSDSSTASTESHEFGNSTTESSSSSSENKKNHPLIHRMKLWVRGKKSRNGRSPFSSPELLLSDKNSTEGGKRIRRYSTSMIPERRDATTESPDTAKGLSRLRRVSFNDVVRTSEPLFESSVMAPKATAVSKEPNNMTPAAETNETEHEIIGNENSGGSSSDCDDETRRKQNLEQERIRAVAEVDGVDVVATRMKMEELGLGVVFLIFISIITLYYRIF